MNDMMISSATKRYVLILLVLVSMLLLTGCGGGAVPNIQTMVQNLSNSYPNIWKLGTAAAYVIGWSFILKALYNLKVYGEARTMMSVQSSLKTPITLFITGSALIYSPTAFQTMMWTLFATPSPLGYTGNITGWSPSGTLALVGFIQIVGLFAFIRGWILMAKAGEGHAQPGTFGKGLTHIVGGVLAINLLGTVQILKNTFIG